MGEQASSGKNPDERLAYFGCKNCGAVNQQPFPEVRVVTKTEPCRCGISSDSRTSRHWATAVGFAVSIALLAGFGSCVADHHFTTEQIKALPKGYTVDHRQVGDAMGPEYKVRKLTPEEETRRATEERIKELEKALEEKKTGK